MTLKLLQFDFCVCKINSVENVDLKNKFTFLSVTDDEISLVCPTENIPKNADSIEDGWVCLKIEGVLDFSLIGIISKISSILASENIGIFVISTFNTDYILIKKASLSSAVTALKEEGYTICS